MDESEATTKEVSDEPKQKRADKSFFVTIYRSWCKNCGICVAFCPTEVFTTDSLERPEVTSPERCTGCEQCVLHCPDFAIRVDRMPPPRTSEE